jgi:hypothetical protein
MRHVAISWAATALVPLLLVGCAARPPARAEYPGIIAPLQEGWGRVYVSAGKMDGMTKLSSVYQVGPVYLNGQQVGSTAKGEHFIIDLLPGTYEASCSPEEPDKNFTEQRPFRLAAGQTKYLACEMVPKGPGMYFGLVGALASTYLTKTYLTETPLEAGSRLVAYTRLGDPAAPLARAP